MRVLITAAIALLAIISTAWGQAQTAGAPLPITARQLSADELRVFGWGRQESGLLYDYGFMLSSNDPGFAPFAEFNALMATFRTRAGQVVTFDIGWGAGGHAIDLTNFRLAPQNAQYLDGLQASRQNLAASDIPVIAGYRFVSAGPNGDNWVGAWRSVSNRSISRLVAFSPRTHASEVLWEGPVQLSNVSALPGLHGEGSAIDLAGIGRDGHVIIARLQVAGCSKGPSGTDTGPLLWERRPGQSPLSSCGPPEPAPVTSAPAGSPGSRSRRSPRAAGR
jgi:hypothetical protein